MKKQWDIEHCFHLLLPFVLFISVGPFLFAQQEAPPNRGFASIKQILDRSCAACHDWTGSYEKIVGGGHVMPKEPEKSTLYQMIANDTMPMSGPKLTAEEKALIRAWIVAGAPDTDTPIAVSPAKAAALPAPHIRSIKVPAHIVCGFASTALFTAAGVIGVIHFWWAHVGLVASGEALYLFNAVTGLTMLSKHVSEKITKAEIHRAVIGVTIPAIMLFAGIENIIPSRAKR